MARSDHATGFSGEYSAALSFRSKPFIHSIFERERSKHERISIDISPPISDRLRLSFDWTIIDYQFFTTKDFPRSPCHNRRHSQDRFFSQEGKFEAVRNERRNGDRDTSQMSF
jgi:hypothetical protein